MSDCRAAQHRSATHRVLRGCVTLSKWRAIYAPALPCMLSGGDRPDRCADGLNRYLLHGSDRHAPEWQLYQRDARPTLGTRRWEELSGDRRGQWAARLTANWRLIVRPEQRDVVIVIVVEIVDYHRR